MNKSIKLIYFIIEGKKIEIILQRKDYVEKNAEKNRLFL